MGDVPERVGGGYDRNILCSGVKFSKNKSLLKYKEKKTGESIIIFLYVFPFLTKS